MISVQNNFRQWWTFVEKNRGKIVLKIAVSLLKDSAIEIIVKK